MSRKLILSLALAGLVTHSAFAAKPGPKNEVNTQWYIKTSLEVTNPGTGSIVRDTRSGVFGQLLESESGPDRHDLPGWSSTVYSQAAIVFIQDDSWGERAGEYLSDYRAAGSDSESWTMTVRSAHSSAEASLSWNDLVLLVQTEEGRFIESSDPRHPLVRDIHLIDLKTGKVMKAFKPGKRHEQVYRFDMDGDTERQFRWVLGKVDRKHLTNKVSRSDKGPKSAIQRQQSARAATPAAAGRFGTPPGHSDNNGRSK